MNESNTFVRPKNTWIILLKKECPVWIKFEKGDKFLYNIG